MDVVQRIKKAPLEMEKLKERLKEEMEYVNDTHT
jgi:hypothetical protein